MAEQKDNKLNAFDTDNGEKLDIKKNQSNDVGNLPTSSNPRNTTSSSGTAKAVGYFFLIASVALFIVGAVVNPWAALAGGICLLGALTCIGASMYTDWKHSEAIKSENQFTMNENLPGNSINSKNTQENVSMLANEGRNKPPLYKIDDFHKNNNLHL